MPLHDHFHPPVATECSWESFHSLWISTIVQCFNERLLPERYVARGQSHLGTTIEVDVETFERAAQTLEAGHESGNGAVATAVDVYAPPEPALSAAVEFAAADVFEVQIVHNSGGYKLVAAIELVSPANKDRPAHRRTFATKCASYLARGISVVVVDVVTERRTNLHAEIHDALNLPGALCWVSPTDLAAVGYRMIQRQDVTNLEIWPQALAIGAELPTLPLWLAAEVCVPLELERTYAAAYRGLRLP